MSNEDNDIIKTTESLEDLGLLIDKIRKTVKNKIKNRDRFLGMWLVTSGVSMLGDRLRGKTSN